MEPETINQLIAQNPKLERLRDKLEMLRGGNFCIHRNWGFGSIQSYEAEQNKVIINFSDGTDAHAMDPAFCVEKLEILPSNHVLVRQINEPEMMADLIDHHRVEVIVAHLQSKPDQQTTASEIERMLERLIPSAKKRKKWWTDTKKDLVRDPRIAVPSKKTEPYILREEEITPEEEILEKFYETKKSKERVILAEKLYQLSQNKTELKKNLESVLNTLTKTIKDTRLLSQADRLYGVWVRNDLARDESTHVDVETLEPTSKSIIIESADNLDRLAAELPSPYYKRFLDLLTRVYPDRWEEIIIKLLRHSEGKFTNECIAFLYERGKGGAVNSSFERWLNEQTMRGPILLWVVKNRRSQKYAELIERLLHPRLLNAVFYAIDLESLQNSQSRRIPLADALSDDAELIPLLLDDCSAETARDLAQTLLLNQGFDDLTKKSLLVRFIRKFPAIQSLVDREVSDHPAARSLPLTLSRTSFEKAKAEYDHLLTVLIPENKKAIETAREHGDLRENAEYKMARQDNDTLMARKAELDRELGRARVTDFSEARTDVVGIGCVVQLREGQTGGVQERFAILGAWDSDPDRRILSYLTPLGQSLLSKAVGTSVETEIDGLTQNWTIEAIERWVDAGW